MSVLTVYEAARQLGCTSQWIRVLLAEQRLAGAQKIEGRWRIPATALEALKQRRDDGVNRLTPEAAQRIRGEVAEKVAAYDDASSLAKEFVTEDPDVDALDAAVRERLQQVRIG